MHWITDLLGIAWRHRSELLAAGAVLFTAVYAFLTYFILRANQRTVAAMQTQSTQARQFHMRQHFLAGIAAIAQYDIDSPGCEQAMRLLDYYSYLALSHDDSELFHILNTVMTDRIRKNLEEIQAKKQEIYVDAVAARTRVQVMLKDRHMERKGLTPK
jgi:hypothetical protein